MWFTMEDQEIMRYETMKKDDKSITRKKVWEYNLLATDCGEALTVFPVTNKQKEYKALFVS